MSAVLIQLVWVGGFDKKIALSDLRVISAKN